MNTLFHTVLEGTYYAVALVHGYHWVMHLVSK